MIKIEKLLDGATGTIERNGKRINIYQNMLINGIEAATIEVTGKVMYTVDESEIDYFMPKLVVEQQKVVETTPPVAATKKKIVVPDSNKNLG